MLTCVKRDSTSRYIPSIDTLIAEAALSMNIRVSCVINVASRSGGLWSGTWAQKEQIDPGGRREAPPQCADISSRLMR